MLGWRSTIAMAEDADSDGGSQGRLFCTCDGRMRRGLRPEVGDGLNFLTHPSLIVGLSPGRADYLFFIADNHRFLTVETAERTWLSP